MNNKKFLIKLLISLCITLSALFSTQAFSAKTSVETRIVGGSTSSSVKEWMVALSRSADKTELFHKQFCGGSLINESWVLTAAHCVVEQSGVITLPSELHAFVGEWDLNDSTGTYRLVAQIIVHPEFDRLNLHNDIALLKLSSPVAQQPISLLPPFVVSELELTATDPATDVTVFGWGDTEEYDPAIGSTYPYILHEVALPYVSNGVCNGVMNVRITDNMMCAGFLTGGYDSCQGDSGGPLIYSSDTTLYLTGLVSWGNGCAEAGSYGVYTRVEKYAGWIRKALVITPAVDFGVWIAGKAVTAQIEIDNTTGATFILSSILNSNADVFSLATNSCVKTFNPGDTCILELSFIASVENQYIGEITLATDIPGMGTIIVDLSGEIAAQVSLSNMTADGSVDNEIEWAMRGDSQWTEQRVTVDGGYSMQSGTIMNNQMSNMFAYVTVPDSLPKIMYFDWKVCSEPEWDYLELWVDNVKQGALSGNVNWEHKSVKLTGAGNHVVEWRYNKDIIVSQGNDAGWVDNVRFDGPSNMLPQQTSTCVINPPVSGGGATSPWLYLGLGIPLMMRRRLRMH